MLPRQHRLRARTDFTEVTRKGRRVVSPPLVVHVVLASPQDVGPARVGLTIGKAVGNSVARHRMSRVLRHAVAEELGLLPSGSRWVIRAMPEADPALAARAWRAAVRKVVGE